MLFVGKYCGKKKFCQETLKFVDNATFICNNNVAGNDTGNDTGKFSFFTLVLICQKKDVR
jgi:hypothetical protein